MLKLLVEGTKKKKWKDRVPYAYWKGNPDVSPNREDLMTCNVSDKHDWNARLYAQVTSLVSLSFLVINLNMLNMHVSSIYCASPELG